MLSKGMGTPNRFPKHFLLPSIPAIVRRLACNIFFHNLVGSPVLVLLVFAPQILEGIQVTNALKLRSKSLHHVKQQSFNILLSHMTSHFLVVLGLAGDR